MPVAVAAVAAAVAVGGPRLRPGSDRTRWAANRRGTRPDWDLAPRFSPPQALQSDEGLGGSGGNAFVRCPIIKWWQQRG